MNLAMGKAVFPVIAARQNGRQDFRISRESFFDQFGSMIIPKRVPWKDSLDMIVLKLQNGGIINHLTDQYIPQRYVGTEFDEAQERNSAHDKITLEHLLIAIGILGIGIISAAAIFLYERCHYQMMKKPLKKPFL